MIFNFFLQIFLLQLLFPYKNNRILWFMLKNVAVNERIYKTFKWLQIQTVIIIITSTLNVYKNTKNTPTTNSNSQLKIAVIVFYFYIFLLFSFIIVVTKKKKQSTKFVTVPQNFLYGNEKNANLLHWKRNLIFRIFFIA